MINEAVLESLKCSTTYQSEHFLNSPKVLSCGHMVCVDCIQEELVCNKCDEVNTLDLTLQPVVEVIKTLINANLKDLAQIMDEKLKHLELELTDKIKQANTKFDQRIGLLENEIEVRIESMKSTLDKKCNLFKELLKNERENLKNQMNVFCKNINDVKYLQNDDKTVTIDGFYHCNRKILQLNNTLDEIKKLGNTKINFFENNQFDINFNSIGTLEFDDDCMLDRIETDDNKLQKIELGFKISQITEIIEGKILIGSNEDECLALYDEKFNFLCKIDEINGVKIKPNGLCYSEFYSTIYVSNETDNNLIQTNLNLNYVRSIKYPNNKTFGDIDYFNNRIFACIPSNKSIEVLDAYDLKPISTHYLMYAPLQIRTTYSETLCIQHPTCLLFYNMQTFQEINEPQNHTRQMLTGIDFDDLYESFLNKDTEFPDDDPEDEDFVYNTGDSDRSSTETSESEDVCDDEDSEFELDGGPIMYYNDILYQYNVNGYLGAYHENGKLISETKLNYNLPPHTNLDYSPMAVIGGNLAICSKNIIALSKINA